MSDVSKKTLSEAEVLRLGRTLRRFSRTSKEAMKILGVTDDSVRIPRRKRASKKQENRAATVQ